MTGVYFANLGTLGGRVQSDFKLVLATANPHKVDELVAILNPLIPSLRNEHIATTKDFDVADPVENATSFEGNALIKARALARASGLATVADDSGLAVDVLGGAPGIFSARWSGRHGDDQANLELLLNQLADVPARNRGAQFVCAAALITARGDESIEVGVMRGSLATKPVGNNGFGYDPIFIPTGQELTNAQMSAHEKNEISHRAKAFRALAPHIARALDS